MIKATVRRVHPFVYGMLRYLMARVSVTPKAWRLKEVIEDMSIVLKLEDFEESWTKVHVERGIEFMLFNRRAACFQFSEFDPSRHADTRLHVASLWTLKRTVCNRT